MTTAVLQGARYLGTSDNLNGSFRFGSNIQLSVTNTATTSAGINSDVILLSATDYYRFAINATADATSPILPNTLVSLLWNKGDTLSVISVSGSNSELSIIIPA